MHASIFIHLENTNNLGSSITWRLGISIFSFSGLWLQTSLSSLILLLHPKKSDDTCVHTTDRKEQIRHSVFKEWE